MTTPPPKRQRTTNSKPRYELLYHPGIPGRGEYIRLLLEAAGVAYTDIARDDPSNYETVKKICIPGNSDGLESEAGNPPIFAPPALRVTSGGEEKVLLISQTPNILAYLGERTGMAGDVEAREEEKYHVAALALTALDWANELHDTHHPIANAQYYEEQKDAALQKAKDVRETRIPKFVTHFQRVLRYNKENGSGGGKYLVGGRLTYADTTVWQTIDGCFFAFPREMEERKKEFPDLLVGFYEAIKGEESIKKYLESERRQPYGMGIFRHYPELDRPES